MYIYTNYGLSSVAYVLLDILWLVKGLQTDALGVYLQRPLQMFNHCFILLF